MLLKLVITQRYSLELGREMSTINLPLDVVAVDMHREQSAGAVEATLVGLKDD